jgi:chemotaxis protein methyltransferase CheR
MSPLQIAEWKLLAGYIQSISGIQLDESKQYLMESRLRGLMDETKCLSYGELYTRVRGETSGTLERSIINAITTGETSFFRDSAPFQLLRQKLLPALVARRSQEGAARIPIRIWSAACSSGQEAYSIAMILREVLGPSDKYDIRLVGTDISPEAVRRATAGIYNGIEAARGTSEAMLGRYFERHGDGWRVRAELRSIPSFRVMNLMRDFSFLGEFDIVFCRNVAIYFSEADKAALFERMSRVLAADGVLIVGSTESLVGMCPNLTAKKELGAVYYQKGSSAAG